MIDSTHRFLDWAPAPPMGWNSWDCFATTVTEEQTRAQADYMARHLKPFGWNYIVVDIQWYEPNAESFEYRKNATLMMDGFGRLQPAVNKFPSSANGAGFTALADYVHGLGLKFGIHLMRGIPRQAADSNLPVLDSSARAGDIADRVHVCPWNPDMYGVDMDKSGAQEYYDSVFALIARWGVDFVKVDDLSRPYFQNQKEVEAIRRAIDKTGRPIVLSLSPGATDLKAASHVNAHANLWRISDDFWDRWLALKDQFWRLEAWNEHRRAGAWPDADMLPLGTIALGARTTRFTEDEQRLMLTLWCIARSPLMHGGDLTKTDPVTLALLTNPEVIAVNQRSADNRPLWRKDGFAAWAARDTASGEHYLAVFNLRDRINLEEDNSAHPVTELSAESGACYEIDIDSSGSETLTLLAHPVYRESPPVPVRWEHPRFVTITGEEIPLIGCKRLMADAQWDSVSEIKADEREGDLAQERDLAQGGEDLDACDYVRALASAAITYAVPQGAVRFLARVRVEGDTGAVRVHTVLGRKGETDTRAALPVIIDLSEVDIWNAEREEAAVKVRDLWSRMDIGTASGTLTIDVPFHGARLLKLTPLRA